MVTDSDQDTTMEAESDVRHHYGNRFRRRHNYGSKSDWYTILW